MEADNIMKKVEVIIIAMFIDTVSENLIEERKVEQEGQLMDRTFWTVFCVSLPIDLD